MNVYVARSAMRLLNLRYRLARTRAYVEQGFYLLQTPLRLATYGTVIYFALSSRGVLESRWFLILSVPVGLAVFYAAGVLWTRYGWQQEEVDVPLVEGMSWAARVGAEQQWRIMAALDRVCRHLGLEGCRYGEIPPTIRREIVETLASFKGNGK